MLKFAIQPPTHANPGVPLYPPVAARLSSTASVFAQLSNIWAVATLIKSSGEGVHGQLSGKVVDSAHPLPESGHGAHGANGERDRAYFYFPGLVIAQPGHYRIRVSLMQMQESEDQSGSTQDAGAAKVLETVDSRSINVDHGDASYSRPSK
jgi:hypothetical protein